MSKELSGFEPLAGFDGIHCAQNGALRCTAIRLNSGGICLYSPVQGLGETALNSLKALGDVTHLLAPNHYHNKGLQEYAERFPDATLCSSEAARPRLEKQTGLQVTPLEDSHLALPPGATLLTPDGLKTGEVWVGLSSEDARLWIVTDAFCGPKSAKQQISDQPELLGTFPKYGIADRENYHNWLQEVARTTNLTTLVPCHGSIVSSDGLTGKLLRLVAALS